MPSELLLLSEIFGLSSVVCLLHSYRHRLGSAAFYAAFGVFASLLFTIEISVVVQFWGATPSQISSVLFVPMILIMVVLIYVLDGTLAARRFLVAIVVAYVVQLFAFELVSFHIRNPPKGVSTYSTSTILLQNPIDMLASLTAVLADSIAMLLVYQFLRNRMPVKWLPVPLYVGLIIAMGIDGWVYGGLHGRAPSWDGFRLPEKLQAGLAAGLPMAIYIRLQLTKNPSLIQRGTLDIIDLRRKLTVLERHNTRLQDLFSRYVSPDVVETLTRTGTPVALTGEERLVTVLFSDLRGFSTLGEALTPTELVKLINQYLRVACPPILDAGGMINEVEGDGILAIFGAPMANEQHAKAAVAAGVQIRDGIAALNQELKQSGDTSLERAGLSDLGVRIGIHTGSVVLGHIGTERRSKYAAIGDAVNMAARVEALNKEFGTSLLLTEQTRGHADLDKNELEDRGEVVLKGRRGSVRLWSMA